MKLENVSVFNIENAIRGMRNPKNSWCKSDSTNDAIGKNDLELAKKLIKAGSSDRKFLRQIFVSMDITAPLYFWKELDQYKVGTTTNSQSTMHKLASTPITIDCFEVDDYNKEAEIILENGETFKVNEFVNDTINKLEMLRQMYLLTKNKKYWKELIRWLPESWLQMRTWTGDYETLRAIYHQRKNHKLTEWHIFCNEIEKLPYSELIMGD